jgi:hypothetical protein
MATKLKTKSTLFDAFSESLFSFGEREIAQYGDALAARGLTPATIEAAPPADRRDNTLRPDGFGGSRVWGTFCHVRGIL